MPKPTIDQLVAGVLDRDRKTIAQAITLVESLRPTDADPGRKLLETLAPHAGKSRRIGVSGIPGVGKSTFIEAIGLHILAMGHRVAVLAVDPTSAVSGGSILGDKTRMEQLSRQSDAFIRPTAGGGRLGGIAPRTREAMLICEAAGFDTVLIETIGVGQSEAAVRDLVDTFVLLMISGAGDDLQGIKRGVLELADLIFVNKADGDGETRARRASSELEHAMQILHGQDPSSAPRVATCSARSGAGIAEAWDAITAHHDELKGDDRLTELRRKQDLTWFDRKVDELLRARFLGSHSSALQVARESVSNGELAITAASRLLD